MLAEKLVDKMVEMMVGELADWMAQLKVEQKAGLMVASMADFSAVTMAIHLDATKAGLMVDMMVVQWAVLLVDKTVENLVESTVAWMADH